jgi:hypothetical protein
LIKKTADTGPPVRYHAAFLKMQSFCHKTIESALEKLFDSPFQGQAARRFNTMTRLTAGLLTGQEVRISELTTGQSSSVKAISEWN